MVYFVPFGKKQNKQNTNQQDSVLIYIICFLISLWEGKWEMG